MSPGLASSVAGGLWGLAVGNVLGLEAEGLRRAEAVELYGRLGGLPRLPVEERGRPWDDDLAMAVELGEWIAAGECPGPRALLDRYLRWSRSNGRGIGVQTRAVLERARSNPNREPGWAALSHQEERKLLRLRPAQGNGSVMRVAPVGLAFAAHSATVDRIARLDAGLTHADPRCGDASVLMALWAAALVRGEADPFAAGGAHDGPSFHPEVVQAARPLTLAEAARIRSDGPDWGHCLVTLRLAAAVLASEASFGEGLLWVLRQGGDTDTNGAVAGALLGARHGLDAIPPDWRACVSQAARLEALVEGLLQVAPITSQPPEVP